MNQLRGIPTPESPRSGRSPKHAARDAIERATPAELGTDSAGILVLFKLVARLNHKSCRTTTWPSHARLSADTGIPIRTLRRVLERLQDAGLVRIHRYAERGQANEYVVDVDELCRRAGIECDSTPIQIELQMLGAVS